MMDGFSEVKALGNGAFGSTILVREQNGPLKVLKKFDVIRVPPAARVEAQREVSVLRQFAHPNMTVYYGVFIEHTSLKVIVEFADGGDLAAAIQQKIDEGRHFLDDDAVSVFAQCLLALEFIHTKFILHRNLTCRNIFLTRTGVVKIGDICITKIIEHIVGRELEGIMMIAAPGHLAPEVCEGLPYGSPADIWSAGVALYTQLALLQPFDGYTIEDLVASIIAAEVRPLPERCCDDARVIVQHVLQKRPGDRLIAEELLMLPAVSRRHPFHITFADKENTNLAAPPPTAAGGVKPSQALTGDSVDELLCTAKWSLRGAPPLSQAKKKGEPLGGGKGGWSGNSDLHVPSPTGMTPQAMRLHGVPTKAQQAPEPSSASHLASNTAERRSPLTVVGGALATQARPPASIGIPPQHTASPRNANTTAGTPRPRDAGFRPADVVHRSSMDSSHSGSGLARQKQTFAYDPPLGDKRSPLKDDARDQPSDCHLDAIMNELLEREKCLFSRAATATPGFEEATSIGMVLHGEVEQDPKRLSTPPRFEQHGSPPPHRMEKSAEPAPAAPSFDKHLDELMDELLDHESGVCAVSLRE